MPFKVIYRNLEVVCESIEDIDTLADRQEQRNGKSNAVKIETPTTSAASTPPSQQSNNGSVHPNKIVYFLGTLGKKPLSILTLLASAPSGLSDAEIREALKIAKKTQLAGIMSAIAKLANSVGIGYENVLTKKITDNKHGDRKYHYSINESVKKELIGNSSE